MSTLVGSHAERVRALAVAIASDNPVLIWGAPGEGKTSIIEQIADANGVHCETVIASIHAPEDFKGLPTVIDGKVVYYAPDWAQNVSEAGGGIVFFDEISTAPPSTQAAMLRPVLSKVAGNLTLPPTTRFVAAANPPEIAADGWDLSAPLANRFVHIDWSVDAATIADGFAFGFAPAEIPTIDENKVEAEVGHVKAVVAALLNSRPDLKSIMPKSSTNQGRAWPSPRSWEMLAKAVGTARAAGESKAVEAILAAGCVGPEVALEFRTFEDNLDLPDVEKALKTGTITLPDRADKVYMTTIAITRALLENPTKDRLDVGVNKLLLAVADAGHKDMAIVGLRKIGPDVRSKGVIVTPAAVKAFGKMLAAMGKLPQA
jgi:hypothetical protein